MAIGLVAEEENALIPLKNVSIDVSVCGFLANVEASLKYVNTSPFTLEVIYIFPVDEKVAIYKLEADIDDRHIVAEIQEKEQARETYNEAVRSGRSAVLMEEHDTAGDIFRCKLGNLPSNSDADIKFAFMTELEQETDGSLKFVLPTVLNPRYNPSKQDGGISEDMSFSCMDSCYYTLDFNGSIVCKDGIARVWSDSDKLTTSLQGWDTMKIKLDEPFRYTHNLTFFILYEEINQPHATLERGDEEMAGSLLSEELLMLSFYPDLTPQTEKRKAEFVFIIDRSGSMDGEPINSAKEAMLYFLQSLPMDCFFNVVCFGSWCTPLFPGGSERYGRETVYKAKQLQYTLSANMGGTNILAPLEFVYRKSPHPGYQRQVFLLTDGSVSNVDDVIALVKRNSYDSRVFTVGIGEGVSASLVRNVAKAGDGIAEFVTGSNKLKQKVMKLLKCAIQPSVTNLILDINLPNGMDVTLGLPKDIPNIFSGGRCTLYAFLKGQIQDGTSTGTAHLTGHAGVESFSHTITFDVKRDAVTTSGMFIHRMGLKAYIRDLEMDEKAFAVDRKQDIIVASFGGNIISKYTSFVGVDKKRNIKLGCRWMTSQIRAPAPRYKPLKSFAPLPPPPQAMQALSPSQPPRPCAPPPPPGCYNPSPISDVPIPPPPAFHDPSQPQPTRPGPPPPPPGRYTPSSPKSDLPSPSAPPRPGSCPPPPPGGGGPPKPSIISGVPPPLPPFVRAKPPSQPPEGSSLLSRGIQGSPPPPPPPPPPPQSRSSAPPAPPAPPDHDSLYTSLLPSPEEAYQAENKVSCMVMLQEFDGSWALSEHPSLIIDVPLDVLQKKGTGKDMNVWATAVAVCWLTLTYPEEKNEWELVVSKATDWLALHIGGHEKIFKLLEDVKALVFGLSEM